MTKLSNTVDSEAQHICIFGEPYTGKSTLAMTPATFGKLLLWFSFDRGHTVLRKLAPHQQELVDLVRIPDTKDNPVGIQTALKVISGAAITICEDHGAVDCAVCKRVDSSLWTSVNLNALSLNTVVVFDHITQIADSAMQYAIERSIRNHEKDATGVVLDMKEKDYFKPGHGQYMMQGFLMTKFLTNVQQSNNHIICIAHVAEVEQEDGKKKLVPLIGSVPYSRNSPKYFDHLVCCEVTNKEHRFASDTTYSASIVSGSRRDISIEHKGKPTLEPFFSGSIPKISNTGVVEAKKVLTSLVTPAIVSPVASVNDATKKRSELLARLNKTTPTTTTSATSANTQPTQGPNTP